MFVKGIIDLLNQSVQGQASFEKDGESKAVKPGDIAVLTNNHAQAQQLLALLNENFVPAVIAKSGNVFDSPEAKAVLRFLTGDCRAEGQFCHAFAFISIL